MPDFFDEEKIRHWLFSLAANYIKSVDTINYIFCSDDYLLDINKTYLDHDYYTDIITFPYRQDHILSSDIYISIDRVNDNANALKVEPKEELLRVIAHGILHLCGLKDKEEEDVKLMRLAEEGAIQLYDGK